jgi:uncharacterized membrane protein YecN with MAPEG domain
MHGTVCLLYQTEVNHLGPHTFQRNFEISAGLHWLNWLNSAVVNSEQLQGDRVWFGDATELARASVVQINTLSTAITAVDIFVVALVTAGSRTWLFTAPTVVIIVGKFFGKAKRVLAGFGPPPPRTAEFAAGKDTRFVLE